MQNKTIKYEMLNELLRNVNYMLREGARKEDVASVEINTMQKGNENKLILGVNYGCCGTLSLDKIDVVIEMLDYAKKGAKAMNDENFEIEYEKEEEIEK